jgi:aspartyl-tRNA(Asn)/glutamyl-tRNA(Gln) amidotransferase subunit C
LDEVNTDNVPPMTRVADMKLKKRTDEVTDGEKADDIVANAPMTEDHYFVVPKVVE